MGLLCVVPPNRRATVIPNVCSEHLGRLWNGRTRNRKHTRFAIGVLRYERRKTRVSWTGLTHGSNCLLSGAELKAKRGMLSSGVTR